MATSMILDETKVTLSAGGESVEMTGKQLEQVTRRLEREAQYRQPRQAGLDAGEPDEGEERIWTLEDEFNASEDLLAARARLERAKSALKEAKLEADEAAATWQDVHRRVRLAKERGQW